MFRFLVFTIESWQLNEAYNETEWLSDNMSKNSSLLKCYNLTAAYQANQVSN